MLHIDGERKRQGQLHLRVAHGQSLGLAGLICNTQFIRGARMHRRIHISIYTCIYMYRKIVPAVHLGGLALLAD